MSGTKSGFSQPAIGDGPAPKRVGPLAGRNFLEVRFGGTPQQGVALMGLALAMAATRDHRYVTQTQTHSPDEGDDCGHGHSDIIISDEPVDYPELLGADLLVALCQTSADSYISMLRDNGVFVYDSEVVSKPPRFAGARYGVPFGSMAQEISGEGDLAQAVLALGAVVAITGVVSARSLQTTLDGMGLGGSKEGVKKSLAHGLALDISKWAKGSGCT